MTSPSTTAPPWPAAISIPLRLVYGLYAVLVFLAFNAHIEFHPAMTPDDLAKAGPAIERAVERFGK